MSDISNHYNKIADNYNRYFSAKLSDEKLEFELFDKGQFQNPTNWKVLEIGCGGGRSLQFLAQNFVKENIQELWGIDISDSLLEIGKKENMDARVRYQKANMNKLPFENDSFDYIFSRHTIHYSEDLKATFKEIGRVLKPSGKFFFIDVHPYFTLTKKKNKDYFIKEMTDFDICKGSEIVTHPSFTIEEYINTIKSVNLDLEAMYELPGERIPAYLGDCLIPKKIAFLIKKR